MNKSAPHEARRSEKKKATPSRRSHARNVGRTLKTELPAPRSMDPPAKNGRFATALKSARQKSWAVLLYLVADDPQGGELFDQVANRELDRIVSGTIAADGSDPSIGSQMHVAVQVDFRSQPFVWRRIIREGAWVQPESNAADPTTLYGFFEWAKTACPADNHCLILWGHSAGPFGLFRDDDIETYVAQSLTLNELHDALEEARICFGKPLDLLVCKDCHMATLETAYQLKDVVRYVIASPGLVPAEGWPYDQVFQGLIGGLGAKEDLTRQAHVSTGAIAVTGALERYYATEEKDHDLEPVFFTLLDLGKANDSIVEPLKEISATLAKGFSHGQSDRVRRSLPSAVMDERALLEVDSLAAVLEELPELQPAASRVRAALRELVISPAYGPLGEGNSTQVQSKANRGRSPAPATAGGIPVRQLGLFCYPFAIGGRRRSALASNSSRRAYEALALSRATGWHEVAFMADDRIQAPPLSGANQRTSGNAVTAPAAATAIKQQLDYQGRCEYLERTIVDSISRAITDMFKELNSGMRMELGKGFNLAKGFNLSKGFNLGKGFNLSIDVSGGGNPDGL